MSCCGSSRTAGQDDPVRDPRHRRGHQARRSGGGLSGRRHPGPVRYPGRELLAPPASEFVARFVGTDRGLKRLSLRRVRDLQPMPTVTAGRATTRPKRAAASSADPAPWLLLVDAAGLAPRLAPPARHPPSGTLAADEPARCRRCSPRMTLRDALSMLLAADVITGVAVDRARAGPWASCTVDRDRGARDEPAVEMNGQPLIDWGWMAGAPRRPLGADRRAPRPGVPGRAHRLRHLVRAGAREPSAGARSTGPSPRWRVCCTSSPASPCSRRSSPSPA